MVSFKYHISYRLENRKIDFSKCFMNIPELLYLKSIHNLFIWKYVLYLFTLELSNADKNKPIWSVKSHLLCVANIDAIKLLRKRTIFYWEFCKTVPFNEYPRKLNILYLFNVWWDICEDIGIIHPLNTLMKSVIDTKLQKG